MGKNLVKIALISNEILPPATESTFTQCSLFSLGLVVLYKMLDYQQALFINIFSAIKLIIIKFTLIHLLTFLHLPFLLVASLSIAWLSYFQLQHFLLSV